MPKREAQDFGLESGFNPALWEKWEYLWDIYSNKHKGCEGFNKTGLDTIEEEKPVEEAVWKRAHFRTNG